LGEGVSPPATMFTKIQLSPPSPQENIREDKNERIRVSCNSFQKEKLLLGFFKRIGYSHVPSSIKLLAQSRITLDDGVVCW
jgi:hypothetical protein